MFQNNQELKHDILNSELERISLFSFRASQEIFDKYRIEYDIFFDHTEHIINYSSLYVFIDNNYQELELTEDEVVYFKLKYE